MRAALPIAALAVAVSVAGCLAPAMAGEGDRVLVVRNAVDGAITVAASARHSTTGGIPTDRDPGVERTLRVPAGESGVLRFAVPPEATAALVSVNALSRLLTGEELERCAIVIFRVDARAAVFEGCGPAPA